MGSTTARRWRLTMLFAVTALICSGLVTVTATPADAVRKPARVKKVKLTKPRITGDTAKLKVKWKKAPRAQKYRVRWSTSTDMSHARGKNTRKRKLTLKDLAQGQTYCVQVRAKGVKQHGKRKKGRFSKKVCRETPRLDRVLGIQVGSQYLQGAPPATTALAVTWPHSVGATAYELVLAPGQGNVHNDPQKLVLSLPATPSAPMATTLGGLVPGGIYCMEIRAVNRLGAGAYSPQHCKYTMPTSRAVPTDSYGLDIATWNVCSTVCTNGGRPWIERQAAATARMLSWGVDAIAIQEGGQATADLVDDLTGYTKGCQAGDGPVYFPNRNNQALFVKDATYEVLPGTARGMRVDGENAGTNHGGCWVEVRNLETGDHVVLASIHLRNDGANTNWDSLRYEQTQILLTNIQTDINVRYPTGPRPPIVLAGDFNSYRNRNFDGPRERLAQTGFDDVYDVAGSYLSPTYLSSYHGWRTAPDTSWRWGDHMDRVFVPAGAHATSWRTDEPLVNGHYSQLLSDHAPVLASIRMPHMPVAPEPPEEP